MSGDTELNVDSLIARLLEGNIKIRNEKFNDLSVLFSSTWMSTRKNCSNDRRGSKGIMFEIS
jgi:hypothetical protein